MVCLPTHICVTRPQWVNYVLHISGNIPKLTALKPWFEPFFIWKMNMLCVADYPTPWLHMINTYFYFSDLIVTDIILTYSASALTWITDGWNLVFVPIDKILHMTRVRDRMCFAPEAVRGRGGISVKNTRLGDNIIFNRNWKIPKLHTTNL